MASAWRLLEPHTTWRGRSFAERADAIEAACRGAMQVLQGLPDGAARLARIDPVPESTRILLRRLASAGRHG
jgi:hypothetical protein